MTAFIIPRVGQRMTQAIPRGTLGGLPKNARKNAGIAA
jgi:hypothetical protein